MFRVFTRFFAFIAIVFCQSCITTPKTSNDLGDKKAEFDEFVKTNQNCYLQKASKQAAFLFDCPVSSIQSTVGDLTEKATYLKLKGASLATFVSDFPIIQSIHSTGCKKKVIFQVFCEYKQPYVNLISPEKCPCRISQDSNLQSKIQGKGIKIYQAEERQRLAAQQERLARERRAREEQNRRSLEQQRRQNSYYKNTRSYSSPSY